MVGQMMKLALENLDKPPKAAARECGYSVDAIYAAIKEKRPIPQDARRKLSQMHPMLGVAIALQDTGYEWFSYIQGDRHPQTMLRRVEKEDAEADEALRPMGFAMIDKLRPEDLTPEDKLALNVAAKEVSDRIRADINLLIEWECRYKLGLLDYLTGKQKPAPAMVAEKRVEYKRKAAL